MKKSLLTMMLCLSGCAIDPAVAPPPQTVTVTKTVAVFPPDQLYQTGGPCNHAPEHTEGTVRDLANALIDERAAVDACQGDRASLRQWKADNSK